MHDLLRAAHRVQRALEWLAWDLSKDDPATRRYDRDVAGMLRQLASELQRAVEANLPPPDTDPRQQGTED
jgi:hypothetical protein